jgi:multidrug efflux pump subunit AcrA (membrane-fusion protein)
VEVDAVRGKRYVARLREIIPMGDRSRGVVKVKVTIIEPDGRLFPELSATVHFLPSENQQTAGKTAKLVFAPADALVTGSGGQFVWRVREGQAWKTPVETQGPVNEGRVVVAGDIYGGDILILNPPSTLENGAKVRVAQ